MSVNVTGIDTSIAIHVLQVQFIGCFCTPFCQMKANPSIANATKGSEFAFIRPLDQIGFKESWLLYYHDLLNTKIRSYNYEYRTNYH